MNLIVMAAVVAVAAMASLFVFTQIRSLYGAARIGWRMKNYTMTFWAVMAMLTLILAMAIFVLSMYDMIDGKFDLLYGE